MRSAVVSYHLQSKMKGQPNECIVKPPSCHLPKLAERNTDLPSNCFILQEFYDD